MSLQLIGMSTDQMMVYMNRSKNLKTAADTSIVQHPMKELSSRVR